MISMKVRLAPIQATRIEADLHTAYSISFLCLVLMVKSILILETCTDAAADALLVEYYLHGMH